jgi:Ca2+-binding EF-hand superfamily protein
MGGHGMDREGGGQGHGVKAKIRMQEFLDTYDANGDGRVTQDEVDQWRADRLKKFDADGNGQLSLDEYQQLWLDAMHERMVRQFQSHDADGDGLVTTDEFGKRTAHMVMMRDRNDDDAISLDDLRRRHGPRDRGGMRSDGAAPESGQPGAASGEQPNAGTSSGQQ